MDPATAKSCVGPCLYWCPNNKHNTIRVGVLLLVFVAGLAFGIMITRVYVRRQRDDIYIVTQN